jgi:aminocarboxymuconate-semialdehyde decarboxylase
MSSRREFMKELVCSTAGIFFVGCNSIHAAVSPQHSGRKSNRRQVTVGRRRVRTIDVHCHCLVDIRDLVKDHCKGGLISSCGYVYDPFADPHRPIFVDQASVEARLRYMDEHGIDIQAVSLEPGYNYAYWADQDLASRIVERQHKQLAELCAAHPDRFVGLGGVALQHPEMAVEQMEYGVKRLGLRGFEIGGNVNGDELSVARFDPFWTKAEELGIMIFLHPDGFPEVERRFEGNGFLTNLIGNPLETTVALSHLIFDGTLDRHPGVKICAAHGGGFLASYLGRSNHCVEASPNCRTLQKKPSEYFKQQLYCDTIVYTAEGLRHLLAEAGPSHVLFGTDFPAAMSGNHMGDDRGVDFILGTAGLSDADQDAILGNNAARLLGISS